MANKDKIFSWMLYLSIAGLLVLFALQKVWDTDVWLHLGIGKYIVENRALPQGDIFTYTSYGKPYEYFEWLFQASLYLLYHYAGYHGLMVFKLTLWLLTMGLLWLWLRTEGVESRWAAFFTLFPAYFLSWRWRERPELVGYFCIIFYLWVLALYRHKNRNYFYFLPWLQILWINSHPSALLGVLIYSVILVGEGIDYLGDKNKGNLRVIKALAVMTPLLAVVSLINPHGYKSVILPYLFSRNPTIQSLINEWLSIWHFSSLRIPYLIFLIPAALSFIPRFLSPRKNLKLSDLLLFMVAALLPNESARYISVFAIIALPLAGKNVYWFFNNWSVAQRWMVRWQPKIPLVRGALPLVVLLIGLVLYGWFPRLGAFGWGPDKYAVPKRALAFIRQNHLPGRIYNEYTWGGYIILEAYPSYFPYIDSRPPDLEVFKETRLIHQAFSGWEKTLEQQGVNLILVRSMHENKGSLIPLVPQLIQNSNWVLVWGEEASLVFLRNSPENQFWVQKFALSKVKAFDEIIEEGHYLIDTYETMENTYSSLGWAYMMKGNFREAKAAFTQHLKLNPQDREAQGYLRLLTNQGY